MLDVNALDEDPADPLVERRRGGRCLSERGRLRAEGPEGNQADDRQGCQAAPDRGTKT